MICATGYGPVKGRTHKGELTQSGSTHQILQMDGMAQLIFEGINPIVPVDGIERLKNLKIIDAIYLAARTGKKLCSYGNLFFNTDHNGFATF